MTKDELIKLINRLDTIAGPCIGVHQSDVAHISLIGRTEDVFALDAYLTEKEKLED